MKFSYLLIFFLSLGCYGQNYTSFMVGNPFSVVSNPKGGVCLMGGATEHDEAMKWFLQQADGGDILVLRASGSDGYNDYMLNQLGVPVNSVETIVCNNSNASQEAYIQQKIKLAEGIWFAGGDQWDYVSYWRNTPIDSLVNLGISERNVVVGGTSAGMVIQGKYYFSAQNGTVTSAAALANPYNSAVTVSSEPFIENRYLENVITDTHYDNPDRKGRHVVFMSRILQDQQAVAKGIACEEYTAVCIDSSGFCKIYGDYPTYDEDVYFIQPNCELAIDTPETCVVNTPLTWNRGGMALKVYHAKGTPTGTQTFDLNDWTTGTGGVWEHWYVVNGVLTQTAGTAPNCGSANFDEIEKKEVVVYPNPASDEVYFIGLTGDSIDLYDSKGKRISIQIENEKMNVSSLVNGIYFLQIEKEKHVLTKKLIIAH